MQKRLPKDAKLVRPEGEEYSLNNIEMAQVSFCARMVKEKKMEYDYWHLEMESAQKQVEKRLEIEEGKSFLNWQHAFESGKVYKLHVKSELHKKSSKGNKSKA